MRSRGRSKTANTFIGGAERLIRGPQRSPTANGSAASRRAARHVRCKRYHGAAVCRCACADRSTPCRRHPTARPRRLAATTVVVGHPGVIRALLTRTSDLAAGEALVSGEIDILGDAEAAFAAFDEIAHVRGPADWAAILAAAAGLPAPPAPRAQERSRGRARLRGRLHSLDRDRAAIAYHYDLSNEFYALWLDRDLTYSCAYFRDASETLDEAQCNKYEHICRKLRLAPGERLLDVGCSFYGIVRYAARERHGALAVGITLSVEQAEYARARGTPPRAWRSDAVSNSSTTARWRRSARLIRR